MGKLFAQRRSVPDEMKYLQTLRKQDPNASKRIMDSGKRLRHLALLSVDLNILPQVGLW